MRIALGCDHRGFTMKEQVKDYLREKGHEPVDCGTNSEESADYPDHIFKAAELLSSGDCQLAIGICYTGIGSSIAANKVKGVRASLCQNAKQAVLTRQHNDSNMLILGSGFIAAETLLPIVEAWLQASFEGGRHKTRVDKIKQYEQQHCQQPRESI